MSKPFSYSHLRRLLFLLASESKQFRHLLLPQHLFNKFQSETAQMSSTELKKLNRKTVLDLHLLNPDANRYKLQLVVKDETNTTNLLIIGMAAELLFGVSCYQLVIEDGYDELDC